jgi:outer membrane lipoprotein-sorting protein
LEKKYEFIFLVIITLFLESFSPNNSKINQISEYINNIQTISSDFIQTNSNGESFSGIIKIKKPGLLLLDYDTPSNNKIISNGKEVALVNKKNKTTTYYNLEQLPIKIFLDSNFSLNNFKIIKYQEDQKKIEFEINDKKNNNSGSIKFIFQDSPLLIKKWIIKDIQGFETQMFLSNTTINSKLEDVNFKIEDPKKKLFGNTR